MSARLPRHRFHRKACPAALAATPLLLLAAGAAQALVVPGSANPNLAGRDAGYACCVGDVAPAQSPVPVAGSPFAAGDRLSFVVSGRVSNTPSVGTGSNPDGDAPLTMTNYGDGLSAPANVRLNALLGVFLGDASPTGSATPASLDFAGGLDFVTLSPLVGQIFFIGDGLTGSSFAGGPPGQRQQFVAPAGATRLFLGTSDGFEWNNNAGRFDVAVTVDGGPTQVPETPSLPLVLTAAAALVLATRRRR